MATEDDDAVATLCAEWEAIMMHGLPCGQGGKGKSCKLPLRRSRDSELGTSLDSGLVISTDG